MHSDARRCAAENGKIQGTTAQQTTFLRQRGDGLHHQPGFEHAVQEYEQAARGETQAAIERATSQQHAETVQELHRIEQTFEQNVSEHHLQILTQMNRVAKRCVGEQRAILNTDAIQALHMPDERTAQQSRARDELNGP